MSERRGLPGGGALRPFADSDVEALSAAVARSLDDLRPWMWWAAAGLTTPLDLLAFVREAQRGAQRGDSRQFAVLDEQGRIAGGAGLHAIERRDGVARCGYWIASDAQGRGLATQATASLVDLAFEELGLNRVELRIAVDNARSRRVAERLGFALEGILREAERVGDGHRDHALYATVAAAWRRPG